MPTCLVGLGANLGHREAMLRRAVQALEQLEGVRVTAHSRLRETPAVGGSSGNQPVYLNAAVLLETDATASALLAQLLEVERQLGRTRSGHWGPRTIDIDLLLHGQTIHASAELNVPHPWLAVRRFVLEPAVEIAPQLRHPQIDWTIQQLWDHLQQGSPYLAVTGWEQPLVTQAVREAAAEVGGQAIWSPAIWIPSGVAGSDDRQWESETTLLQARARQLEQVPADPQERPRISNFWLTDALAAKGLSGWKTARHRLMSRLEHAQSHGVPPWLVVLLEPRIPTQATSDTDEAAKHRVGQRLDPLQLRELVMHAAPGPWLKLQVTTANQAAQWLVAAIHSRGPQLPHPRRNA